ncbi:MAG: hypothetical protein JJU15_01740 [Pararhodobacter sp.]|nr:hypothetical protein [Pararhodobacter sp.]
MIDKVIVTIATTSNCHGKGSTPVLPEQPGNVDQFAPEAFTGMFPAHLHARDLNRMQPRDPQVVRK